MENDHVYFTRRAEAERQAEAGATCTQARDAHAELALRYADLANTPSNVVLLRRAPKSVPEDTVEKPEVELSPLRQV